MEKRYQLITTEFFDKMDKEISELTKKETILSIVTALTLVFAVLGLVLYIALADFFGVVALISFITCVITAIIGLGLGHKVKMIIDDYELKFYDQVFAPIVAYELGGTVYSHSFKAKNFRLQNAVPGYILSSRDVMLDCMVNGRKIRYVQAKKDEITSVITKTNYDSLIGYKQVVAYNHSDIKSDIRLGFKTRKNAASTIKLTPMAKREKIGKHEKIVMDNKEFRFHVDCDNELTAYKYLTADAMEELESWKETSNIKELVFDGATGMVRYPCNTNGIDLDYEASFTRNMKRNRKKYSPDIVLTKAMDSANNIRLLMESVPNCIA